MLSGLLLAITGPKLRYLVLPAADEISISRGKSTFQGTVESETGVRVGVAGWLDGWTDETDSTRCCVDNYMILGPVCQVRAVCETTRQDRSLGQVSHAVLASWNADLLQRVLSLFLLQRAYCLHLPPGG